MEVVNCYTAKNRERMSNLHIWRHLVCIRCIDWCPLHLPVSQQEPLVHSGAPREGRGARRHLLEPSPEGQGGPRAHGGLPRGPLGVFKGLPPSSRYLGVSIFQFIQVCSWLPARPIVLPPPIQARKLVDWSTARCIFDTSYVLYSSVPDPVHFFRIRIEIRILLSI